MQTLAILIKCLLYSCWLNGWYLKGEPSCRIAPSSCWRLPLSVLAFETPQISMCQNEVNQQERQMWENEVLIVSSNLKWNCLCQTKHRWRGNSLKERDSRQTTDLIYFDLKHFEGKQQEIHWCEEFLLTSNQFMGPRACRTKVNI